MFNQPSRDDLSGLEPIDVSRVASLDQLSVCAEGLFARSNIWSCHAKAIRQRISGFVDAGGNKPERIAPRCVSRSNGKEHSARGRRPRA